MKNIKGCAVHDVFPSDISGEDIITKHTFCLLHWPKLHFILGDKNKEVRLKLTLRNKLERRRFSILEASCASFETPRVYGF